MPAPESVSADRSTLRRIRFAATVASAALVTYSGSRLWEWWRVHQWFEDTIGRTSSSGQTLDLKMRPIEDISGLVWCIATIVCTVLALSGYAVLRRSVTTPKVLLGLGGSFLWALPLVATYTYAPMRPNRLATTNFALWTLAAVGGVVVLVLAALQPRAARQS